MGCTFENNLRYTAEKMKQAGEWREAIEKRIGALLTRDQDRFNAELALLMKGRLDKAEFEKDLR